MLERNDEDTIEAVNDLSEDVRKDIEDIIIVSGTDHIEVYLSKCFHNKPIACFLISYLSGLSMDRVLRSISSN